MAVDLEFLKRIPYFSGLGAAELDGIRKLVRDKEEQPGAYPSGAPTSGAECHQGAGSPST